MLVSYQQEKVHPVAACADKREDKREDCNFAG